MGVYRKNFMTEFRRSLSRYEALNFKREKVQELDRLFRVIIDKNVLGLSMKEAEVAGELFTDRTLEEISEKVQLAPGTVGRYSKLVSDLLYEKFEFLLHINDVASMDRALRSLAFGSRWEDYFHIMSPLFGEGAPFEKEEGVPDFHGSINDCRAEANFLRSTSLEALAKQIREGGLSVNKIVFLLRVLSGEEGSMQDTRLVRQIVTS